MVNSTFKHIDLNGPYTVTTQQNHPECKTKELELHLTCMTILNSDTGCFEIVEVCNFIVEDMKKKEFRETMGKSSVRIRRLFDQT